MNDDGGGLAAILAIILMLAIGIGVAVYEHNAPCSHFRNYSVKHVPARCLAYYDQH